MGSTAAIGKVIYRHCMIDGYSAGFWCEQNGVKAYGPNRSIAYERLCDKIMRKTVNDLIALGEQCTDRSSKEGKK